MLEWIAEQDKKGNTYAVEVGKRLKAEFGDIPYPSRGALAIYQTASILAELQMMDTRSPEAEKIIVDRMFGDLMHGQRSLAPADVNQTRFNARFRVITDREDGKYAVDVLTREIYFESFFLKDDFWLIKFNDAENDRAYEVQPVDLIGIAEKRSEV